MNGLFAGLLGATVGLGLFLAVAGWRGVLPTEPGARVARWRAIDRLNQRAGLGLAAAVVVYGGTGWPMGAVAASAFGVAAPTLVGARARRRREVDQIEAVARWAEQLRDTMSAAAGLHEALAVTARVAPAPIRDEVQELAAELRHEPLPGALRRFAARLDSPAGDQVTVALLLAAERQGAHLSEVLSRVAASARAEAALRLRVEAQRARTYSQARLISGVIAAVVAAYVVLNRGYLAPFSTPFGQIVLGLVAGLWFVSFWSLVRLAEIEPQERILGAVASELTAPARSSQP